jgi:hypothetical protein
VVIAAGGRGPVQVLRRDDRAEYGSPAGARNEPYTLPYRSMS